MSTREKACRECPVLAAHWHHACSKRYTAEQGLVCLLEYFRVDSHFISDGFDISFSSVWWWWLLLLLLLLFYIAVFRRQSIRGRVRDGVNDDMKWVKDSRERAEKRMGQGKLQLQQQPNKKNSNNNAVEGGGRDPKSSRRVRMGNYCWCFYLYKE